MDTQLRRDIGGVDAVVKVNKSAVGKGLILGGSNAVSATVEKALNAAIK